MVLSLVALALAADDQRVVLHATFGDRVPEKVVGAVQQTDARQVVTLVDDGSDPADARGDRVYTGSVRGTPAQYLMVTLSVTEAGATSEVWTGAVRAGLEPRVDLAFEVTTGPDGTLAAHRRASASPGRLAHATEALPLLTAAAWGIVALGFGAFLAADRRAARGPA